MQLKVECYSETGFINVVYWEYLNLLNRKIKLIWRAVYFTDGTAGSKEKISDHREEEYEAEEVMKDKKKKGKNRRARKVMRI
jgi:hypothetical protein